MSSVQTAIQKLRDGNYHIKNPTKSTMRMDEKVFILFHENPDKKEPKKAAMEMPRTEAKELINQVASAIGVKIEMQEEA